MKRLPVAVTFLFYTSCREGKKAPEAREIAEINLKKGAVVLCGPADKQFGDVSFSISSKAQQEAFNLALALLHSFEYDEAEKVFAAIIEKEPGCVMAYWGVAMSNYHPLWAPPAGEELEKGARAVAVAQSIAGKSAKENAYIHAIAAFYEDWKSIDHRARTLRFERAMEKVHLQFPEDKDAAIFYALALDAAADPADKTYSRQKKAGKILNALYPGQPDHPGIVHYIIHSYDYPELAAMALPAARKYASIAPSSAHAQHMPSHIFTRLGLWDECIASNLAATSSAKCYAEAANMKGHWDEEVHGMDYLVYAYLQKGDNERAKAQCEYLQTFENVYPQNFKVAYGFASMPSRYVLENKDWKGAAALALRTGFPWEKYPWESSIVHFTKVLGNVHTHNLQEASAERAKLKANYQELLNRKDSYKANQVNIQLTAADAWLSFEKGDHPNALTQMRKAADMEDATEKHPVTPSEVVPARELLADMLMEMKNYDEALREYEQSLKKHANRFNGLYGAAVAAEKGGDTARARSYYKQLVEVTGNANTSRRELQTAKTFLN